MTTKETIEMNVKICEMFAIEFAEWVNENYVCFQGNYQRRTDNYWHTNNLSIKSVLEIYKKEKEEINKSFYCKNETFVKNYYGEYCEKQCEECKLKSK